jgi:hypothetical protein
MFFATLREPSHQHELPHPYKESQHAPNRLETFPIRLLVLYLNHRNPPYHHLKSFFFIKWCCGGQGMVGCTTATPWTRPPPPRPAAPGI